MGRVIKDDRGTLHGAEFTFSSMDNVTDPTSIDIASGRCPLISNWDIDDNGNAIVRGGYTQVTSTDVGRMHGDLCVSSGAISRFDGETITELSALGLDNNCEFVDVNNVVVFSDNTIIGIISGDLVTQIDQPSNWVDVLDLETWIKNNYPADPADYDSNFEVDAFKLATFAGQCLEFYNGSLYLAVDNFVYVTETFNIEKMDIRYNVVAGFPGTVTMISAVTDGLFVGTDKGLYFLLGSKTFRSPEGTISGGFKPTKLSQCSVFSRSAIKISPDHVQSVKSDSEVTVFATEYGIMAGLPGGSIVSLSKSCFDMSLWSGPVAAIHRMNGEISQYLASFDQNTVVVNLNTGGHSVYSNFSFYSFTLIGSDYYGSRDTGVFKLFGSNDDGDQIDATIITPSPDFQSRKLKSISNLYVHGRSQGEFELKITADEDDSCDGIIVEFDDRSGIHSRRAKGLPLGLKGTNLQLGISNVDGKSGTISQISISITESQRTAQ